MPSSRARLLPLLALPALLAGGCVYDYKNPAEVLGTGEVAGRVVADPGGGGAPAGVADVQVELRNSFNAALTRDSGRFFLFGLMPGRHTVLFSKGTEYALQRDVEMAWGADGQPEGVILGDLRLRRAVTLRGKVLAPALPFGFSALAVDAAAVLDEETGQQAQLTAPDAFGAFEFTFPGAPVGRHRLRLAVAGRLDGLSPASFVAGPIVLDVPESSEGLQLAVTDTTPTLPTGAPGKLRFRVAVAGASFAGPYAISVVPLPVGSGAVQTPTPDSTGACELDLPPGLYDVRVGQPVGAGGSLLDPPPSLAVVAEAQTSELGTFYLVDSAVLSASSQACLADEDCLDATCQAGACKLAACLTGSFASACSVWLSTCAAGNLTTCGGGKGFCAGSSVDPVCIPAGSSRCQAADGASWSLPICRPN